MAICRSDKVEEVKKNPWGEVAWYFEDSREQYRLGGNITIVGHDYSDEKLLEVKVNQLFSPCAAHMITLAAHRLCAHAIAPEDRLHSTDLRAQERKRVWSGMSPPGRGQFLNPHPGEPRKDTDESLYDQACFLHSTSPAFQLHSTHIWNV